MPRNRLTGAADLLERIRSGHQPDPHDVTADAVRIDAEDIGDKQRGDVFADGLDGVVVPGFVVFRDPVDRIAVAGALHDCSSKARCLAPTFLASSGPSTSRSL